MACELDPSVTLYGTTQVSSLRTITHTTTTTYLGEPAITLQTLTSTVCDDAGSNCRPEVATSLVTITPTVTTTIYSTETRSGLVTNVVPQQTLYYPCSTTTARQADATGVSEGASTVEMSVVGPNESAQTSSTASSAKPSLSDAAFTAPTSISLGSGAATSSMTGRANTATARSRGTAEPSSTTEVSDTAPSLLAGSQTQATPAFTSSSTADPSATLSASSSSSSSTSKGPVIAGAVVGTLVGFVLFCILIAYCRRNRDRGPGSSSKSIGTIDYWERRFRDLEADDSGGDNEKASIQDPSASPTSPLSPALEPAGGMSKKLRLTLDLHSKGMSTRPASRLSAISAFFSSKPVTDALGTSPAVPLPVPFAAGQGKSGLNFSRPRFGKRHSTISGASRVSGKSGKSGKSSKQGGAPNNRKSIKSVSNWLNFGAPPVTPTRHVARDLDLARAEAELDGNGRRAMEWMRPAGADEGEGDELERRLEATDAHGSTTLLKRWSAVDQSPAPQPSRSDSPFTPSLLPTHDPLASRLPSAGPALHALPPLGRQLTPPKRSTFGMAMDLDRSQQGLLSTSCARSPATIHPKPSQSSLAPTVSIASLYTNPSTEASVFAPVLNDPAPSTAPRPSVDSVHIESTNSSSPGAHSSTLSPSNLAAPKSFGTHRQPSTSRKNAPELLLSRDAITPSLWIDEEVYDQFRLGHEYDTTGDKRDGQLAPLDASNVRPRHAHTNVRRPDQSRFSPDSSIPTLSALPTSSSEDPYGGIADTATSDSFPRPHPQPADSDDCSLNAYRRRADTAFFSVPPSAAISLAGSMSTCEDDAASASVGRAWRTNTARPFDRSAVTPQLPFVHFSGSPMLVEGVVFTDVDRGTEERMQTMYHVD